PGPAVDLCRGLLLVVLRRGRRRPAATQSRSRAFAVYCVFADRSRRAGNQRPVVRAHVVAIARRSGAGGRRSLATTLGLWPLGIGRRSGRLGARLCVLPA